MNPVREIVEIGARAGVPVLVDGAQGAPHMPVDVQALGCDFYAFSGHKLYGPSGIGVLWGRRELLEAMPPWQGGGEMIENVTLREDHLRRHPGALRGGHAEHRGRRRARCGDRLRAGDRPRAHRRARAAAARLRDRACSREIPGLTIIGTARDKAGVLSFVLDGVHAHDVATILDREGVAVRAGHHCAQPVMQRFGVAATVRASFGLYNTREEVDALASGLRTVFEVFG